jgi:hypothetical protein
MDEGDADGSPINSSGPPQEPYVVQLGPGEYWDEEDEAAHQAAVAARAGTSGGSGSGALPSRWHHDLSRDAGEGYAAHGSDKLS